METGKGRRQQERKRQKGGKVVEAAGRAGRETDRQADKPRSSLVFRSSPSTGLVKETVSFCQGDGPLFSLSYRGRREHRVSCHVTPGSVSRVVCISHKAVTSLTT